jgi:hypothetical protein
MTIRISATGVSCLASQPHKSGLASDFVRGFTRNLSRRLGRDEIYSRHHRAMLQDAGTTGRACLAELSR